MTLENPHFIVVTADNVEQIKAKYLPGKYILYAVTPTDFKKLTKNQVELKRYIDQQSSIIVYYEKVANAK